MSELILSCQSKSCVTNNGEQVSAVLFEYSLIEREFLKIAYFGSVKGVSQISTLSEITFTDFYQFTYYQFLAIRIL